jgi:hypothetical protein
LSKRTSPDHFDEFLNCRECAVHERLDEQLAGSLGGGEHGLGLGGVAGDWFFAENILAGLHRLDRPLGVQAVGQRDINSIHIGIVDQRLVTADATTAVLYGE